MHELAVADSIVEAICERVAPSRVKRVILEIGKLSAIEPDAVRFCFDACARGTCVEGAALECVEIPGRGRCRACREEADVDSPLFVCRCGSADVEWVSGDRLLLKAVELV